MNYQIYPVISMDGLCNVPDQILLNIWTMILNEHKYHDLFYDGGVTTSDEWIAFIKSPGNYPLIVHEGEDIYAIAWLNYVERESARCHFVMFGQYHKQIGKTIINYWKGLKGQKNNQLLSVLVGLTPETNIKTAKLMKLIGFNILGVIPHFCYMVQDDKLVGATIGYLDLKEA